MTVAWRQTACRMRHCFARRIVETGGRRELGCTSIRWAERHPQGVCRIRKAAEPPTAAQQRMIGAEANRLAEPLAASEAIPPRRHFHSGGTKVIRARGCQSKPFSWGSKGAIFFREREWPFDSPPARCRDRSSPFGLQNLRALWARKKRSTLAGAPFLHSPKSRTTPSQRSWSVS